MRLLEDAIWLVGSIAVRAGRLGMRPLRAPTSPAHHIRLKSLDGLAIAATYWPGHRADSPAFLIVHGFAACRQTFQTNAEWFAARGYGVLTIDLRGHGGSGPALCGFGWPESQDVHAAFAWLKYKQQNAPIAAVGISMGGAALLLGPRGPVPAEAIVLQGVFADLRRAIHNRAALVCGARVAAIVEPLLTLQAEPRLGVGPEALAPIAVVPQLRCPLLVIGGEKDPFTPSEETHALFAAAREPKYLLMMPGLGHNGVSETRDEIYRQRVLAFARSAFDGSETR